MTATESAARQCSRAASRSQVFSHRLWRMLKMTMMKWKM